MIKTFFKLRLYSNQLKNIFGEKIQFIFKLTLLLDRNRIFLQFSILKNVPSNVICEIIENWKFKFLYLENYSI